MRFQKLLLLFLFPCIFVHMARSQQIDSLRIKKNTIYAEFLGMSGSACSINYDRVLAKINKSSLDLSIGFGYFPQGKSWNAIYGIPINLNLSGGLGNHDIEIGIGLTYNSGIIQESLLYQYSGNSSPSKSISLQALYCSFRLGYKYQKPTGGLFVRAGFTPLVRIKTFSAFDPEGEIYPLFGLGVGYTF